VGDFTRLAAERLMAGLHPPGTLLALSSRFSRRPAGIAAIVAAVLSVAVDDLEDRVVFLESGPG
jgi:hypothetical protein